MGRKRTFEQEFEESASRLRGLGAELGFLREVCLPSIGGLRQLCLARIGMVSRTEALCFLFEKRPPRMIVEFLASDVGIDELEEVGAPGNSRGTYLATFLDHSKNRDPREILPQAIGLPLEAKLRQLRREIEEASPEIWVHLGK